MSALDTNLKNEIIISDSDDDHSIDYQGQGEEETWEDWEEDERDRVKSLFSDATFSSVDEALAHDAKEHNFDLNKYRIAVISKLITPTNTTAHSNICMHDSIF